VIAVLDSSRRPKTRRAFKTYDRARPKTYAIVYALDRLLKKRAAFASAVAEVEDIDASLTSDYESFGETSDEWESEDDVAEPSEEESISDAELLDEEIRELESFVGLAEAIHGNAKGDALVEALAAAFPKAAALGGAQKAVVFTESLRTQSYLFELLERSGYEGKVVMLNGDNKADRSKLIYKQWLERHQGQDFITGSQAVDVKTAIVEEFRDRATILVATEAAAEGVNLQFCSLVVNSDLPYLASDTRDTIAALEGGHQEVRLEDYIVRGLIDFDDINYDEEADLLYDRSKQFVHHLSGYLSEEAQIRNVLMFHQRKISDLIHAQMQAHAWEKSSGYEAVVSQGFSSVRPQAFAAPADAEVLDYRIPLDDKKNIRNMLFGFFEKCLYPTQKFDSDPERRFVSLLEKDGKVVKWFKPGKGVFQIRYSRDNNYEPDFVVETDTEKFLCEPKRADQLHDSTVLAKARAASRWCNHASSHELAHGGKQWRYLLIPHDQIADNMTLMGLAEMFIIADQLNEADPNEKHWAASGASDRLTAQRREAAANQKGENEEA
jgi:hypothetical protein